LLKKYSEIIKESVSASPECSRTDESKALIDFDHVICEAIKHTYKRLTQKLGAYQTMAVLPFQFLLNTTKMVPKESIVVGLVIPDALCISLPKLEIFPLI